MAALRYVVGTPAVALAFVLCTVVMIVAIAMIIPLLVLTVDEDSGMMVIFDPASKLAALVYA